MFVYPLREKEVVVNFEAVIAGRLVGVHIQSRGKLKDCCLDCCPGPALEGYSGNSREWGCCGMSNLDMHCSNGEEEVKRCVLEQLVSHNVIKTTENILLKNSMIRNLKTDIMRFMQQIITIFSIFTRQKTDKSRKTAFSVKVQNEC